MSLTALFFKKPVPSQIFRTVGGQQTTLFLDATIREAYSATAEPTQHPVEEGADITDHIIIKPQALTLSGLVTETPFEGFAGLVKAAGATVGSAIGSKLGAFGGVVGALGGAAGGASLASSIFGSNSRDLGAVAAEFKRLRDARQPVSIQTGLKLYESFVLSSFTVTRRGGEKGTGGSIEVDLEFKELIRVESQVSNGVIPSVSGALNQSKLGRQAKAVLGAEQGSATASILSNLTGLGR